MLFTCAHHAPADTGGHAYTARKGKKHFTVDIHCHIHVPAADARLAELASPDATKSNVDSNPLTVEINRTQQQAILPKLTDPEERIRDMDASGIDVQAVSSSPFHYNYGQPVEIAREICGMVNDRVAETVASHPDRFVGLGILPLQDEDASLAELDRCINGRGFRGIEISTNVNGRDLTRAGIEKVFAKCEEMGVLIFVHPIGTSFKDRMDDHYFRNTIGHPLESALCVGHLVFDGYLDKYPGLKICIAHGGGYIPAYWGRFDHPWALRDDCRVNLPGKAPSEYVKQLYFDTVVFTEEQLRHMIEVWGADHVVMGTDYPYDMAETDPVGHVDSVKNLSEDDKAKIMGGNAAALLGLEVSAD